MLFDFDPAVWMWAIKKSLPSLFERFESEPLGAAQLELELQRFLGDKRKQYNRLSEMDDDFPTLKYPNSRHTWLGGYPSILRPRKPYPSQLRSYKEVLCDY